MSNSERPAKPTPKTLGRTLIPALGILFVLVVLFLIFTQLWTKKLWFDSLEATNVFTTVLAAQVILFTAFCVVGAIVIGANIVFALRSHPKVAASAANPSVARYRELLSRYTKWAVIIPAAVVGVFLGANAFPNAMTYLAWLNRVPFGETDQYFSADISFFVFELPVIQDLLNFALTVVVLSLIAAAIVHFVIGNVSLGGQAQVVGGQFKFTRTKRTGIASPGMRIQLSILAGLALIVVGGQMLVARYTILTSEGTLFTGMHYTDFHSRLMAFQVMAVIAFICAGVFFVNTFVKRLILPVSSVVLMVVSGLILSMIYPAFIQNFEVRPNEPDKEKPFIQAHIDATRKAFGIDEVQIDSYTAVTQVSPGQLKDDAAALPGVRLIDPAVVSPTFQQLQQVRGYYTVQAELDVDRYVINGKETDAVVAAREIKLDGLPNQQWNNVHTVYTHGNGIIAAYGNRRQAGGAPEWIEKDIPSTGELGDYEGRIYFGENSSQYVIVGREEGQNPIELDTPGAAEGGGESYNIYAGTGGVPIGDLFTRILFATYFTDINLLLSDRVGSNSRILHDRLPTTRVSEVAPWLKLDGNLYPAVVDGRLVWIVDGYTSSANYPNSQLVAMQANPDSMFASTTAVNYLRNSVKAVVDACDGTVDLYAWDATDPLLRTYAAAFPGILKSRDEITPDLLSHLRYPQDLFDVQRYLLGRYHMTDPIQWYQQSDLWQIPDDPRQNAGVPERSHYLSIKWPTDDAPIFSTTGVYVPRGRQNLAAYLSVIAEATSPDYGKLRVLRMSDTQQIDGPGQTFNAMTTDRNVADVLRAFLFNGSAEAIYGNLLTLPMGSGLIYVLPVYAQRQASTGSYPALTYVIVRFGESVGIGQTLQEALDKVFRGNSGAKTGEEEPQTPTTQVDPADPTTPGTTPSVTPSDDAAALLQQAQDAFVAADEALRNGDLATYQAKVNEARTALAEA
ncbi:MAG: UPF0182 family protein, partial [Propionibacteriaceae bacterium]|nr:UPF0182 family protein [Propionibacteriaceae bacterium]